MDNNLFIFMGEEQIAEFDRSRGLAGRQRQALDALDSDMDQGIDLDGERVEHPDRMQRIQFVMRHLFHAIERDDEGVAALMCAYIATRLPDLRAIRATEEGDQVRARLEFN